MFSGPIDWKRIGSGYARGSMYYLDYRVTPTGLITVQPDPFLLWYWHLGHPLVQKLQFVVPIEFSISVLSCESCKLGKHHRATYQSGINNHNSSTFELIHSDVWGPSRVPSVKGFRCFSHF